MDGWNGGRESSWSYLEETGSIVSSSSGTIVSAYTSNVSRPSTVSMEAAMHFVSSGIHEDVNGNNVQVCEEGGEERIRSLVQEFFSAPAANCSIKVGDISVVERWLKELGVGWVLSLNGGTSAGEELHRRARSWIRALDQITQTFCLMLPLFPDPDSVGLPSLCQREEEHVGERRVPDRYHLAVFILETMTKILNFVDVLVAWDPDMTEEFLSMDQVMPPPYNKLITLLGVRGALSNVSSMIQRQLYWASKRIENEMAILLSAYKSKLGEAIRTTMEKIRKKVLLEDGDATSSSLNPQGSSDIHKVTKSVMTCISLLWAKYLSLDVAIRDQYVPHIEYENVPHLNSMIREMLSCLQEKLANIAESFSDQGLRFLFLLNNSYFIEEFKYFCFLQQPMLPVGFNHQIEDHMERYLQVSWALLLSCLFNPTPLCLGKNYSPMSKFESEFQKIYNTQKQWKVSHPKLRRRLREVITDKIIPGYKEYIEDNKVTNPKFSPQELKAMLQELFEG